MGLHCFAARSSCPTLKSNNVLKHTNSAMSSRSKLPYRPANKDSQSSLKRNWDSSMMAEDAGHIARSVKKLDMRQSDKIDRPWDALLEMKWKG